MSLPAITSQETMYIFSEPVRISGPVCCFITNRNLKKCDRPVNLLFLSVKMCQIDIYVLFTTEIVDSQIVFRGGRDFVDHVQILFNISRKETNIIE